MTDPTDPNIPDDEEGGPYRPEPRDWRPAPPRPRSRLSFWPQPRSATIAIAMWILWWVISGLHWRGDIDGTVSGAALERGEFWRLVVSLFAHSDIGHLLANSGLFLIFGTFLRAFFGLGIFPGLALLLGVVTNYITISNYDPQVRLLGASGMVYAIVGLWLVGYMRFETAYRWPVRLMRALAFALVVMWPTTLSPGTSYQAHFWGFVLGLIGGAFISQVHEQSGE